MPLRQGRAYPGVRTDVTVGGRRFYLTGSDLPGVVVGRHHLSRPMRLAPDGRVMYAAAPGQCGSLVPPGTTVLACELPPSIVGFNRMFSAGCIYPPVLNCCRDFVKYYARFSFSNRSGCQCWDGASVRSRPVDLSRSWWGDTVPGEALCGMGDLMVAAELRCRILTTGENEWDASMVWGPPPLIARHGIWRANSDGWGYDLLGGRAYRLAGVSVSCDPFFIQFRGVRPIVQSGQPPRCGPGTFDVSITVEDGP